MCVATKDYSEIKSELLKHLKGVAPGKYYAEGGFHMVEWSKEPGYYLAIYTQGGITLHFTYPHKLIEAAVTA